MRPAHILLSLLPALFPPARALPTQDDAFRVDRLIRKAGVEDRCIDYACHSFTPAKMCSHDQREHMQYVCWDIMHGGTGGFGETDRLGKMLVDGVRREMRVLERWVRHTEL
ncbi:hypothetical protein HBI74_207070 [Parastagonospora nodorum]|nr:hypothetical protein HBI74_207070 [Parastagonospora nodorum]KAH6002767.1 hypothetical protein HBI83_204450 [Parastagonospora nodorum]